MAVRNPADLYGLPLEQFVPARAALAKELRGEGHREEANRVAALRKPSVAAWVVNQLVRSHPAALAELFAAGDELERAQHQLLAGRRDPGELRTATVRERGLVEQLTAAAGALLSGAGNSASTSTLAQVSETLHAAALQAPAREAVRAGCLDREQRHVGLGSDAALGAALVDARPGPPAGASSAAKSSRPVTKDTDLDRERRERIANDRAARERERERERDQRIADAREAEAQAQRHLAETARAVEVAEQRRDRAAEALHEAEAVLASAREQANTARTAHHSARQALEHAEHPASSPRRSD